jgi:hypothetical protein
MKMLLTSVAVAGLAACGRPNPVAENAGNAAVLPEPVDNAAASPTGGPPANKQSAPNSMAGVGSAIPGALQGRWGLTPGDCTSTRGDAKGLLVVEPGRLVFYESRAIPSPGIQTSPTSASGNFAFTGEGQEWTKYETLQLQGATLVRTERDPNASFSYVRC